MYYTNDVTPVVFASKALSIVFASPRSIALPLVWICRRILLVKAISLARESEFFSKESSLTNRIASEWSPFSFSFPRICSRLCEAYGSNVYSFLSSSILNPPRRKCSLSAFMLPIQCYQLKSSDCLMARACVSVLI